MLGHMFGAAGAIEAVACALAIHEGTILSTINYENPIRSSTFDYVPNEARAAEVRVALSNAIPSAATTAASCWDGLTRGLTKYRPRRQAALLAPRAASSVAPVASGYERSLRPCLGTTIAARRRAIFRQALLRPGLFPLSPSLRQDQRR